MLRLTLFFSGLRNFRNGKSQPEREQKKYILIQIKALEFYLKPP